MAPGTFPRLRGYGLKGTSGFLNHASGDTDDSGDNVFADQAELDITLDFKPPEGMLQGFWLSARTAFVDERGQEEQGLSDYRLIINYELPLL